jgi:RNA polymerase sigma-70 factor (ECF subfamily)
VYGNVLDHPAIRGMIYRLSLTELMSDFKALFEKSFHEYYEGLCRYAFTFLKDTEKAKDVVQSVFVKWWEKQLEIEIKHSVKSYLYTAIHNHCLNSIRNEKAVMNFKQHYDKADVLEFNDPVSYQETDLKIKETLENLPSQCRLIFYKSRYEEKTYAQIASELNISPRTVEVQISKALKTFRENIIT